jgi:hypothetical protein
MAEKSRGLNALFAVAGVAGTLWLGHNAVESYDMGVTMADPAVEGNLDWGVQFIENQIDVLKTGSVGLNPNESCDEGQYATLVGNGQTFGAFVLGGLTVAAGVIAFGKKR